MLVVQDSVINLVGKLINIMAEDSGVYLTDLISGLQRCSKIWLQGHSPLSSSTTKRYALTPTRLKSFWRRLWHPPSK